MASPRSGLWAIKFGGLELEIGSSSLVSGESGEEKEARVGWLQVGGGRQVVSIYLWLYRKSPQNMVAYEIC